MFRAEYAEGAEWFSAWLLVARVPDVLGPEDYVFARNLFDKDYMQNLTLQAGKSGLIVGTPSEPRTIGVTLRTHLGR